MDEIITAIFALGRDFSVVPTGTVFTPDALSKIFSLQTNSCGAIARNIAEQSTHPPLFFCLLHGWLQLLEPFDAPLAWSLRSLPALFGVGAIAAIYVLNRVAFSPRAGLIGAAFMAVSPFGVYLSQEARQYSLLLLLIGLALSCVVAIAREPRLWLWLSWGTVNSLGCYLHYFFVLAFVAQIVALAWVHRRTRQRWVLGGVVFGVGASYLPWLGVAIAHFTSPKTGWISGPEGWETLSQVTIGWIVMAIAFPFEQQPEWLQITAGILALGSSIWIAQVTARGWRYLYARRPQETALLSVFLGVAVLEFAFIIFGLQKDISLAPRYNYVYFPAVCALLGAAFWALPSPSKPKHCLLESRTEVLLSIAFLGSLFAIANLAFLKPYLPGVTAERFNEAPRSTTMAMGYRDSLHLALGLSYAYELAKIRPPDAETYFVFLERSENYEPVWEAIATLPIITANVWLVGPGLKQIAFPDKLEVGRVLCVRDPNNYYRIGLPYQRYRCPICRSEACGVAAASFAPNPQHVGSPGAHAKGRSPLGCPPRSATIELEQHEQVENGR